MLHADRSIRSVVWNPYRQAAAVIPVEAGFMQTLQSDQAL
ncbi:hypothetical protein SynBIOSE41_01332 [Synechococcus sp. BIOS-E4-1]|nr:hypothetical protein SynBIOSE41_01332 [Synechococcus sp. BIOS-E4-1]